MVHSLVNASKISLEMDSNANPLWSTRRVFEFLFLIVAKILSSSRLKNKVKMSENLNECEVGSHNCDHICSDRKYGFECSCYEGFELSSTTPNRGKCKDVNECNTGKTVCAEHEFCSNLIGSYECLCKDGFKKDVLKAIGSSNFIGCVDIDECKKNPCAVNEICSNTGMLYHITYMTHMI